MRTAVADFLALLDVNQSSQRKRRKLKLSCRGGILWLGAGVAVTPCNGCKGWTLVPRRTMSTRVHHSW